MDFSAPVRMSVLIDSRRANYKPHFYCKPLVKQKISWTALPFIPCPDKIGLLAQLLPARTSPEQKNSLELHEPAYASNMNTLSIYHHCHLNPFKIRLMTLLPDTFGSDLQSHLARYTLNEAKDYDALSYVWGKIEDRARHLLHVNGYPVILTANLYHALQHIRDPAEPAIL